MAKESLHTPDISRIVLRETFWDEQTVRRNGRTIIGSPTFSNGKVTGNGDGNRIDIEERDFGTIYTIRIITTLDDGGTNNFLRNSAGTASTYWASNTIAHVVTGISAVVWAYVPDGKEHEFLIVRNGTTTVELFIDGASQGTETFSSNIGYFGIVKLFTSSNTIQPVTDLVEVYNYAFTDEEAINFYEGKRFVKLTRQDEILNVFGQQGSIVSKYGSFTPTTMDIVKDGEVRAMLFDNSTSAIDMGSPHDLTGDITVTAWIKPYGWGELNNGRIIDNGKFIFKVVGGALQRIAFSSDGSTTIQPNIPVNTLNIWQFVAAVRRADGAATLYVNAETVTAAFISSGTPEAGSTNLIIGNNDAGSETFDGLQEPIKIYSGLLTNEQLSQAWSSERMKYRV